MHVSTATINRKIVVILTLIFLFFMVIIARLVYLQIFCGDHFALRSQNNFLRHEIVDSPRGNIRDVNGVLLATNRPITLLYWQGTGNYRLSHEQRAVLQKIEEITGADLSSEKMMNMIGAGERKNQKILLLSDIDFATLSKLSEIFCPHENVIIDTHFKRFYPHHNYGCHIVGYLGDLRFLATGKLGLEKIFDADLCGRQGSKCNVVNSAGQRVSQVELEKALSGNDIQTTIDIDMQIVCEKIFPSHLMGSFILLNPVDGAVVSVVSRPNFDPNLFLDPLLPDTWRLLQEKNPFLNRAFDASYPSGSIFKLVTISAAIEHSLISPDVSWNCKGYTLFGNRKYWCARRSGHGEISAARAVAESCNTLFFEIGK